MAEWFELKGALKIISFQPPAILGKGCHSHPYIKS